MKITFWFKDRGDVVLSHLRWSEQEFLNSFSLHALRGWKGSTDQLYQVYVVTDQEGCGNMVFQLKNAAQQFLVLKETWVEVIFP